MASKPDQSAKAGLELIKLGTKLVSVFDRVIDLMAFVAGILAIFMMLAISSEVVTRYFLNSPITGVLEISEMCMLWIVFLGAAWVLKKEGHVGMDSVIKRLKPKAQTSLNIITSLMAAAASCILFWYGTKVTLATFERGTLQLGAVEIPIAYVLIIIPIGGLALFLQFLRRAYSFWKGAKVVNTGEFL